MRLDKTKAVEYLLKSCKGRAARKGYEFDITIDDLYIPDSCPVLGIPLSYTNTGSPREDSASLDRVDTTKGYVKGNVSVISWRANRLKYSASFDEIERIY